TIAAASRRRSSTRASRTFCRSCNGDEAIRTSFTSHSTRLQFKAAGELDVLRAEPRQLRKLRGRGWDRCRQLQCLRQEPEAMDAAPCRPERIGLRLTRDILSKRRNEPQSHPVRHAEPAHEGEGRKIHAAD